jgi:hypothetical protein
MIQSNQNEPVENFTAPETAAYTHTHARTHTHTHRHKHTRTVRQTDGLIQTEIYWQKHTDTQKNTQTHKKNTHAHTHTHAHTPSNKPWLLRLYVRTEELNPTHERTASTRQRMLWMYNASATGDAQHTCISCMEPKDRCDVATATIDSSMHWSVSCRFRLNHWIFAIFVVWSNQFWAIFPIHVR